MGGVIVPPPLITAESCVGSVNVTTWHPVFTVITALPVILVAVQLASVSDVTVYVVFALGLTALVTVVLPVPVISPTPLLTIAVHAPVAVTVMLIVALCPVQTVVLPLSTDVGLELTIIDTGAENSALQAPLFTSALYCQVPADEGVSE